MASDHSSHALGQFIPEDNPESVAHRKLIWKTFWIMLLITVGEFVIAFTMSHGLLRISIFLLMTVAKAFYIVAEFMHLKYEVKTLIWSILIPTMFIIWLIIALLVEGDSVLMLR
jgi:cytochrome c oxidase subunit 4